MRALFLGLCLSLSLPAQDAGRPRPVCEALQNRALYHSKTIYIRGELSSTDEGSWLVATECTPAIVTGDQPWQSIIYLTGQADIENKAQFEQLLRDRGAYANHSKRITVTIVGQFETYLDLSRRLMTNLAGERRYLGYGHLNLALAQLLIHSFSLTDIVVEDRQ